MITDKIDKQLVAQAKALIEEARKIVILTHMSPDGDAIGSSLGMLHYLHALEKEDVQIVVPNRFPDFLHWMPGAEDILVFEDKREMCEAIIRGADLLICLDFNAFKRIGQVGEIAATSFAKKLLLDHHIDPQIPADCVISYPDCVATCELVFRLICRCGHFKKIDLPMAECIYTGLMTDTGNFSYNSNQVDVYAIVGELVYIGVDKDAIYNKVFNTYSIDRMRLMGFCLYNKMKVYPEYHTAFIALSRKELYRFNFQSGDAEGLVNLPLQIKNVHYSVFMREDKDKIKISFRSQGDRPVNEYANVFFNGGGHKNAAGGESYASLEETVQRFEDTFRDWFKD